MNTSTGSSAGSCAAFFPFFFLDAPPDVPLSRKPPLSPLSDFFASSARASAFCPALFAEAPALFAPSARCDCASTRSLSSAACVSF